MAALDLLFRPSFLTLILFLVLYTVYGRMRRNRHVPKGVPWAHKDGRTKEAKSTLDELKALKEYVSNFPYFVNYISLGGAPHSCTYTHFSVLQQRPKVHLQIHRPESHRYTTTLRHIMDHIATRYSPLLSGNAPRRPTIRLDLSQFQHRQESDPPRCHPQQHGPETRRFHRSCHGRARCVLRGVLGYEYRMARGQYLEFDA